LELSEFNFQPPLYIKAQYDSCWQTGVKKHNWISGNLFIKKLILMKKYKHDPKQLGKAFKGKLLHSLPQMLFYFSSAAGFNSETNVHKAKSNFIM